MPTASGPYRAMLLRWLPFAADQFTPTDGDATTGYFGTGHNAWGAMAQASFVGALGYLAGVKDWPADAKVSRDRAADMLCAGFRYLFRTHVTGDMPATNGQHWGFGVTSWQWFGSPSGVALDTWHPPVFFEQALTALPCCRHLLDAEDLGRMEQALAYEADRHAETGLRPEARSLPNRDGHKTNSESNSWTAAMLARAAVTMPGHPHASQWLAAASLFWTNALSVPQDEWDPTLIDGRPRSGWFAGANLGPHYTLEHHGFFHPGYYVWSLWPMCTAMLEFRRAARPPLQAATHHFRECFDVVKRMTVWNGRLAFPAGADWPQYVYGQAFLIALCEYAARANQDAEAAAMADALQANLAAEQAAGADGSFVGRRLGALRRLYPIAYYRYESDEACVAALAGCFCDELPAAPAPLDEETFIARSAGTLAEPAIGLAVVKSPTRFASASFNANISKFQSLVIPPGGGHLLRHSCNGYGRLILADSLSATVQSHQDLARARRPIVQWHQTWPIERGFASAGQLARQHFLNTDVSAADQFLAVFALPDERTVVQIELVRLRGRARVLESGSGGWMLATDIFTAPGTLLQWHGGRVDLAEPVSADEQLIVPSPWVNLAGSLAICGLYGGGGFLLSRLKRRTPGELWTRPRPDVLWPEESLTADELYFAYDNFRAEPGGGHLARQGSLIRDVAFAQVTGVAADQTAALHGTMLGAELRSREGLVRGCMVAGRDGNDYLLAVNFEPEANALPLRSRSNAEWRTSGESMTARFERQRLVLGPRSCLLAWRPHEDS